MRECGGGRGEWGGGSVWEMSGEEGVGRARQWGGGSGEEGVWRECGGGRGEWGGGSVWEMSGEEGVGRARQWGGGSGEEGVWRECGGGRGEWGGGRRASTLLRVYESGAVRWAVAMGKWLLPWASGCGVRRMTKQTRLQHPPTATEPIAPHITYTSRVQIT